VLGLAAFSAVPAHAVTYYDDYGRAFYYNTWGQKVFYDTGYNQAAPANTVVREERQYRYYYPADADSSSYNQQVTTTTYQVQPQPACREYHQTVQQNGELRSETRTECQQSDGTWQ
jgi:hypothetical protein